MTPYELTKTPEFNRLTTLQAIWVLAYIQHFVDTGAWDPMVGTAAAYNCGTLKSLRTHGYHMLENDQIKKTLLRFSKPAAAGLKTPMHPRMSGPRAVAETLDRIFAACAAV